MEPRVKRVKGKSGIRQRLKLGAGLSKITALELTEEKKQLMSQHKFAAIATISNNKESSATLPQRLAEVYDEYRNAFVFNDSVTFSFCAKEVAYALGIADTNGIHYEEFVETKSGISPRLPESIFQLRQRLGLGRKKVLRGSDFRDTIQKMPVVEEGDQYLFKQLMCYYILEELLMCGKSPKTPRAKTWKLVVDLDNFDSVDWAGAVHKHLMDSFSELKKNLDEDKEKDKQFNFMGCTPVLEAILFRRIPALAPKSSKSQNLNPHPPIQMYGPSRKPYEDWKFSLGTLREINPCPDCLRAETLPASPLGTPPAFTIDSPLILNDLEHRVAKVEQVVFSSGQSPATKKEEGKKKRKRREEVEKNEAQPEQPTMSVDLMESRVWESLKPCSYTDGDVIYLYVSYLKRTMSSKAASKSLLQNSYFYTKLEGEIDEVGSEKTLDKILKLWKGNFYQYSYIICPIFMDDHYSLVIVCFPDEEERTDLVLIHLDSYRYHASEIFFYTFEWFLKQMWKNLKGESSDFPTVVTRTVEVPQQTNAYDCGFFVMHMMKLFLEQAPERFKMENLEMFSKNWFMPEEASALREEIRPVLEEELKRHCASTNSAIYPDDASTKTTINSPHVSSSPHPATLEEALISSVQPQPSTSQIPNFDVSLCSADFDEQSPTAKNDLKAPLCSAEPPVYNKKKYDKIMYTRKRLKGSMNDLKAEPPVYNKKKYNKIMYSRKRLARIPFVRLDNVQISGTLEQSERATPSCRYRFLPFWGLCQRFMGLFG